ncbi:MAG: tRNA (adenosine(37)-N6)-dimethylallyltransferase MiaA [Rectinema sp.]
MATNSLPVDAFILAGPTASGKTDLLDAVFGAGTSTWVPRLRDAWQTDFSSAEIISADSMQAYRGMDIGTAKPSKDLLSRLPHHLIDIKNPDEQYTAGEFVMRADALSSELSGRGVLPIISGGTGFYLMNYICGLPASPPSSPEIRAQVAADLKRLGPAALRAELEEADPATASRIHEHDLYRLTRAVEILRTSGEAPSRFAPPKMVRPGKRFLILGVSRTREVLHARIHARVEAMMRAGLAHEVETLVSRGFGPEDAGMQAIGYREFFELAGSSSETIAEAIELHTHQYAKRQMTFFRALPGLRWIDPDPEHLFHALTNFA